MPVPRVDAAADVRGEVDEDRRDHERRHRAEELDDREHALEVGRRQREARDEQGGRDRGAEPDAGQAEPTSVSAWLDGTSMRKTTMPAASTTIPTSGR